MESWATCIESFQDTHLHSLLHLHFPLPVRLKAPGGQESSVHQLPITRINAQIPLNEHMN